MGLLASLVNNRLLLMESMHKIIYDDPACGMVFYQRCTYLCNYATLSNAVFLFSDLRTCMHLNEQFLALTLSLKLAGQVSLLRWALLTFLELKLRLFCGHRSWPGLRPSGPTNVCIAINRSINQIFTRIVGD